MDVLGVVDDVGEPNNDEGPSPADPLDVKTLPLPGEPMAPVEPPPPPPPDRAN